MKNRQMKKDLKKIMAKVRDREDPKHDVNDRLNNVLCEGFRVFKEIKMKGKFANRS